MLSVDRPPSFVSSSLNDIIPKSPSHPFPFIATTSLSPSFLWCIPPLIPSSKSPDDLKKKKKMGPLVNSCVKSRWFYIVSTVKADSGGEARSRGGPSPTILIKRPCQKYLGRKITTAVIINTMWDWQVEYKQADLPFRLPMKAQCCDCWPRSEEARWLSLPPLTFPTTEPRRPIDFTHSRIHDLVTVITGRHRPTPWMTEVTKVNFAWPSDIYRPVGNCGVENSLSLESPHKFEKTFQTEFMSHDSRTFQPRTSHFKSS